MADHYRTALRNKVKALLEEIPALQGRCYINRGRTFAPQELPAIGIYTRRSGAERYIDQWRDKKTTTLEIELHAVGKDEAVLAEQIDQLCLLVECVLFSDQTLGGVCEDIEHKSDEIETDADNAMVTIHCRMTYEVTVIFESTDTFEELKAVYAQWDMAQQDHQIDAEDLLPLVGSGFGLDGSVEYDDSDYYSGL